MTALCLEKQSNGVSSPAGTGSNGVKSSGRKSAGVRMLDMNRNEIQGEEEEEKGSPNKDTSVVEIELVERRGEDCEG
jgi:hypothetical protein